MRCLLVADLHYALRQFDWVLEVAARFDLVVVAGDLLDAFSLVDGGAQIVVVRKYLDRLQRLSRLIVCSGNHDLDATDASGEKYSRWVAELRHAGIPTDGDSLVVEDTLISVCPWWDGPNVRDAIGAQLARDAAVRSGPWFWVYHAPPADSPVSWGGTRHFGDRELSRWIDQYRPDYVLSGHVHQSPFTPQGSWVDQIGMTWVFNTGNQVGPVPTHIVLDTGAMTAMWFSIIGAQTVRLDRPPEGRPATLAELPEWLVA